MRPVVLALAVSILAAPSRSAAADPAPPSPSAASPVASPSAPVAQEQGATAPVASQAPAAQPAAAPSAATTGASPVTPPASAPREEYSSYVVLKGGWFGSSSDFQGESFSGSGAWEVAVGTGRVFGVEISGGSMTTEAAGLEITTVPLLLSLRLQVPIAVVAPFVEGGAGAYFNRATVGGATFDDVTAGWHAGLGCDVLLGRLLLGAQARYMGIAPTFGTVGQITLDRFEGLLRLGLRF
jgi:hypothetical protein